MCSENLKIADNQSNDVKIFAHGSGIVAVGIVLKVVLIFATEVTAARILLPERYGLITWGLFLCNILCMITGLGLNTAVRRFLAIYRSKNDFGSIKGLIHLSGWTGIITGTAGAIALFFASTWLSNSVFGDKREAIVLQVLVFAVPAWTLLKIMLSVFAGFERPIYKVVIEDFFVPAGFLLVVALAWMIGYHEVGIAFGYTIVYCVATLLSLYFVRTRTLYKETLFFKPNYHASAIIKFSWPMLLAEPLGKCTGMIDVVVVGTLTVSYQVGIFRAASDIAAIMQVVLMALAFMYLPIISRFIANGEYGQWQEMNARVARWAMLLSFPIFATLFFFSNEVIQIIYGPHYSQGANVLRILALAYFGHAMVGFTSLNLIAKGMTGLELVASLIALTINITGNYLLIPIFGLKGAALASLLSLWALNIFCLIFMKIRLKLQPFSPLYWKGFGMLALITTVLSFVIHRLGISNDTVSVLIYLLCIGGSYIVLFFVGSFFDETDISVIKTLLFRKKFFGFIGLCSSGRQD